MNISNVPLIPLRRSQVQRLLRDDPQLQATLTALREKLSEYDIILARHPSTDAEQSRARRKRNIRAGMCIYTPAHGPATHGTLCTPCYEKNLKHVRARREKARQTEVR